MVPEIRTRFSMVVPLQRANLCACHQSEMIYKGAPGCDFKGSRFSTDLRKHLNRQSWCPCKNAKWTVAKSRQGQVDGRSTRYRRHSHGASDIRVDPPAHQELPLLFPAMQLCNEADALFATFLRRKRTRRFIDNLAARGMGLNDIVRGAWVCADLYGELQKWISGVHAIRRDKEGHVYAITSPLINCVKIGMWRGSLETLIARYVTYYGEELELVFSPVGDRRLAEKELHERFAQDHVQNELFDKRCWGEVVDAVWALRQRYQDEEPV